MGAKQALVKAAVATAVKQAAKENSKGGKGGNTSAAAAFVGKLAGKKRKKRKTSKRDAKSRLADPSSYDRSKLEVAFEDYIAPATANATRAVGTTLAAQYGMLGEILDRLAAREPQSYKEQWGPSVFDIAASAQTPYGAVRSVAAKAITDAAADTVDEIANRARAQSLYKGENERQADMNIVYSGKDTPAGQYAFLQGETAARKQGSDNVIKANKDK